MTGVQTCALPISQISIKTTENGNNGIKQMNPIIPNIPEIIHEILENIFIYFFPQKIKLSIPYIIIIIATMFINR